MKKISIFVAFFAKEYFLIYVCVVFFIATNTALCATNKGLSNSYRFAALHKSVNVLWREYEGDSPSCFYLFFHSEMPKNNENASMVNNSTHISTDSHETALLLISELNKLSSSLSTKLSITINIIIGNNNVTNSGIVGNNMANSSIVCGDIAVNSKNLMP